MNPVSLSTPTFFSESFFSQSADLDEKISRTVENTFSFMKLELSEADLSDFLLHEWDLEFQQILNRGEKILATLEKRSNFKNQEDTSLSNLPVSAFSELSIVPFESFPDKEGSLPSQNAFLELEPDANLEERVFRTAEDSLNSLRLQPSEQKDTELSDRSLASKEIAFSEISLSVTCLPTNDGPRSNQSALLALNRLQSGDWKSREERRMRMKRACKAAHNKEYRAANKQKLKAYRDIYYQKNKDWIKARKVAHYQKNKDKIKARRLANKQSNWVRFNAGINEEEKSFFLIQNVIK